MSLNEVGDTVHAQKTLQKREKIGRDYISTESSFFFERDDYMENAV